jgi:hypothetical protein
MSKSVVNHLIDQIDTDFNKLQKEVMKIKPIASLGLQGRLAKDPLRKMVAER